jgi:hypothetical protein
VSGLQKELERIKTLVKPLKMRVLFGEHFSLAIICTSEEERVYLSHNLPDYEDEIFYDVLNINNKNSFPPAVYIPYNAIIFTLQAQEDLFYSVIDDYFKNKNGQIITSLQEIFDLMDHDDYTILGGFKNVTGEQ